MGCDKGMSSSCLVNPRIDAGMVNNDGMYRLADSMTNSFKFALVSPLPSWVRYG